MPHGSYRLIGTVNENNRGQLVFWVIPGEWIEQPLGFVSVGFDATSDVDTERYMARSTTPLAGT